MESEISKLYKTYSGAIENEEDDNKDLFEKIDNKRK